MALPGFVLPSTLGYGPRIGVGVGYGYGGFPYGFGYPFGFPGFYGYSGRAGSVWSNGLSLYGPPVPVYGPIPGVFGNNDLVRQWRRHPRAGLRRLWMVRNLRRVAAPRASSR